MKLEANLPANTLPGKGDYFCWDTQILFCPSLAALIRRFWMPFEFSVCRKDGFLLIELQMWIKST